MAFEEIIGNSAVKTYLTKSLKQGTLPRVLLFSGPEGIGKSLFAKEIAWFLLSPDKPFSSSLPLPDLHWYLPEGKAQMHTIESMKGLMGQVALHPFSSSAKVFVLVEAERMVPSTANALLKTLEDSSEENYFILLTARPEQILPTIVSRSVSLPFQPIEESELSSFIMDQWKVSSDEARRTAVLSQGSIGRASVFLSSPRWKELWKLLLEILSQGGRLSFGALSQIYLRMDRLVEKENSCEAEGKKSMQEIFWLFSYILLWYRDLHALRVQGPSSLLFFSQEIASLQPKNLLSLPSLERVHQLVEEALQAVELHIKLTTCLEHFFLCLYHSPKTLTHII